MKLYLNIAIVLLFVALISGCGDDDASNLNAPDNASASGPGMSESDLADKTGEEDNESPGSRSFTVRFDKGATSKSYNNSISPGEKHKYSLGASKGQLMRVDISSKGSNAVFTVLDSVGNTISDGEDGITVFEKSLPSDGNYKIIVSAPREKADYSLKFSVTGGSADKNEDDDEEGEEPSGGLTKTVKFSKGKSSATYEDAVIRAERNTYILGANAGQTMSVSITSLEDNAVFQISGPNGYLPGTEPGKDSKRWSGQLPANGKYRVIVGGTRGNASYKVTFAIK